MNRRSWTVAALTAMLFGGTAAAQEPGSLLVGGFGQYSYLDKAYQVDNGFKFGTLGYGGRLGAFVTPTMWLEAEGSYTAGNYANPKFGKVKYGPISAKMMWKIPSTSAASLHFGVGGVLTNVRPDENNQPTRGQGTYNYGVEGDVGFRFGLSGLNFRVDGLADYMPDPATVNFRAQAGLEFWPNISSWFGNSGGMMSNMSAPWAPVMWWDVLENGPLPGTIEVGGFAQVTRFGDDAGAPVGPGRRTAIRPAKDFFGNIGYGGRLGVFLTDPKWELEGDGSYMEADRRTGTGLGTSATPQIKYSTFALRMNYNIPITTNTQFILGAGGVRTNYNFGEKTGGYTYNYGASGLAGLRLGIANRVALRVDGIADYMPTPSNLNLSARAGLSFLLGGMRRVAMCTVAGKESMTAADAMCFVPCQYNSSISNTSSSCVAPVAMCSYMGMGNMPASDARCVPPAPAMCQWNSALTATDANCVAPSLRPIYFDYDKSTIRADAEATLQANLGIITANPSMRIRIEGNADERGSDEYNIALGQRRSQSAKQWLIDHGVDAGRIDIVSYGEERGVCQDHNETCWQQNRRDDFVITVGGPAMED